LATGFAFQSVPRAFGDGGLSPSGCHLNSARGEIQHVIFITFDNTHFTRDNPNVPSDLEQMPNLLDFIETNGALLTNHHTPLISHTATDILTALTGVYGDQMGVPVANSFRYFNPDGTSNLGVSFAYWTDSIFDPTTSTPTDTSFNMLTAAGLNAPAPWVPFTRAGCDFGAVATANTVLENIKTDIPTVFGAGSTQAAEVQSNPGQAFADFVGIAVHCASGSGLCSSSNGGVSDLLPDEPGGYSGYMALFGHKYVVLQTSPSGPLTDLNGNIIADPSGHIGFPGFDGMSASVTLSYVASLQEHGVPITYAYISDAHDKHPSGPAYGPGEAGYVAALASYNDAFGKFFAQLAADGINTGNTLFVFTSDEGDHFVGGEPSPSDCDGVTTPCTYSQIGEINANLAGLLATEQGISTPFKVHSDSAPAFYLTGNPSSTATATRNFERGTGSLTAGNPITGSTDTLTRFLANPVELRLLHMVTADPARTPTFIMFADPNYFLYAGASNCVSPCVTENPAFAWNHGTVAPKITTTWLGLVGPGVAQSGVDGSVWSDHTDIHPTMMLLLGLHDDYSSAGRVLVEELNSWAIPASVSGQYDAFLSLAQAYKQINAPLGQIGLDSLTVSTRAVTSNSTGDQTYAGLQSQLSSFTNQRNSLASQMLGLLEGAEFNGQPLDPNQANSLVQQAQALLSQVHSLAQQ
jgi:hypothetical protein